MNRARGEVALEIAGKKHTLCLTLGALAEIESALGAEGFAALEARLSAVRARDLLAILAALLRGGGHPYTDEETAALKVDVAAATRAIAQAFAAAGLAGKNEEAPAKKARAPRGRTGFPGGASSASRSA